MKCHISDRQKRQAKMLKYACILFIIEQQDIESLPKGNIITKTCRQRKRLASGEYKTYVLKYIFVDTGGKQYYQPKYKVNVVAAEKMRLVLKRLELEEEQRTAYSRLMKEIKREAGFNKKNVEKYYRKLMDLAGEAYRNKSRFQNFKDAKPAFATNEEFRTDDGDYVRSKNECLFANKLREMGIPYIYEASLHGVLRPDFTVFIGEETIHIELLGMLNDEGYREDLELKKYNYREMKIRPVYIDMTYGVDTKKLETILILILDGKLRGATVSCKP